MPNQIDLNIIIALRKTVNGLTELNKKGLSSIENSYMFYQVLFNNSVSNSNSYLESQFNEVTKSDLICKLLGRGFNLSCLEKLEYLSNPAVLDKVPNELKPLKKNEIESILHYLKGWIDLLEERIKNETITIYKNTSRENFNLL